MIMENANEHKIVIYNNIFKETLDIISVDCKKEVLGILEERMEYYKTMAVSGSMDIEEVRFKYSIYNDIKNLI